MTNEDDITTIYFIAKKNEIICVTELEKDAFEIVSFAKNDDYHILTYDISGLERTTFLSSAVCRATNCSCEILRMKAIYEIIEEETEKEKYLQKINQYPFNESVMWFGGRL
jgi:hypothetical protein